MKIKLSIYLIGFLFFLSVNAITAQSEGKKDVDKYFDESGGFKHRLWYGGGFNLGYQGGDGYSVFNIGITPMVGYKVFPSLSFGPRVGFDYTYLKGLTDVGIRKSTDLTTYSVGIFGRFKFLKVLFLHSEINYQSIESAFTTQYGYLVTDPNDGKILTARDGEENFLAGAGYNSGEGLFGYEISILYNFNVPENSIKLPWDIRVGFTYKF